MFSKFVSDAKKMLFLVKLFYVDPSRHLWPGEEKVASPSHRHTTRDE